jgi:hypothetical protein
VKAGAIDRYESEFTDDDAIEPGTVAYRLSAQMVEAFQIIATTKGQEAALN